MKPFFVALVIGFVAASALVAGGAFVAISRKVDDASAGWKARDVLVVTSELREGEALTEASMKVTPLPEQFVTESVIDPKDRGALVGKKPMMPLNAGDVLTWGVFAQRGGGERAHECVERIRAEVNEAGTVAREAALATFIDGEDSPHEVLEVPAPKVFEDLVRVIVLRKDVEEGTVLTEAHLEVRELPVRFATVSQVPGELLANLVGKELVVPAQAKDLVLWQMLDDPRARRNPLSCHLATVRARDEARARVAKERAAAFFGSAVTP